MIYQKIEVINDLLSDKGIPTEHQNPWAFCVNVCIMEKWEQILYKLLSNTEWKILAQKLQVGTKFYDMRLIIIALPTEEHLNFLTTSISNSQFSFPWEDNPTLFINIESFNIMEKFIRTHNLEAYILKIEESKGITANNDTIKVVSFNKSVNSKLDIINEYLKFTKTYRELKYYFMTSAFPWQQSHWLRKIPVRDDVYSMLPIILNHLGRLNYTNNLNIMDLLSLRWALNNVRNPSQSHFVNYEIDFMIKRELRKTVKNNHLDLDQYLIAKNSKPIELLIFYLVYEFQNFFETINISRFPISPEFESFKVCDTVKLREESNILNLLKEKCNVEYTIDGSGFDRMSLSLFLDLVECHNIIELVLDTNFRWLRCFKNVDNLNRSVSYKGEEIHVRLIGENSYNFIEDFISALKTITVSESRIYLAIYCNLNDYRIFDNLTVSKIKFQDIKIDANLLNGLHQCHIKANTILLHNCTFENTPQNWAQLNNLRKLHYATIHEDEGTWQSLFEFVLYEILKTKSMEFRLNDKIRYFIVISDNKQIDLRTIKFTIDEQFSKLEIRYTSNHQIVDLYDLKFWVQPDDKSEYRFYQ